jgi:hypothetical protein
MADRMTVNQRIQIAAETVNGTGVPATKLLEMFSFDAAVEADVQKYTATGFKYPTEQIEEKEWMSYGFGGNMDYNGLVYPVSSVFGAATITAHLASATAKDWKFTPPSTGATSVVTYSIEQGDAVRAHKSYYNIFTDWGYKINRNGGVFDTTGKLICQPLQDGITLTSSPTAIALAPAASKQVLISLDTTSAGLGVTQFPGVILNFEYSFASAYSVYWSIDRTKLSWAKHVDVVPVTTIKIMVEADANGMALLGYLQSQATMFMRVDAQGSIIAVDGPGNIVNEFIHDMAIKFAKPEPLKDDQGVYAIQFEGTVMHDPTWNAAQKMTITNLLTAL